MAIRGLSPVVIFTMGEGHLSLAKAIKSYLEPTNKIILINRHDSLIFSLYTPFYKYFPKFFRFFFYLTANRFAQGFASFWSSWRQEKQVKQAIDKYQPKICFSTHFLFNPILTKICQQKKIQFINVLSDPRTIHPALIAPQADLNLVFDEKTAKTCHRFSPSCHTKVVGWPVRKEFLTDYSLIDFRHELKLNPKLLTLLFVTGSEGSLHVLSLLKAITEHPQPVQIIVACGHNAKLLKTVAQLKTHRQVKLIALPFTERLYEFMQVADLVIGKAGPNTIFESAATLTPFLATTHISGQEDGNLDIIREYNLGFVEENAKRATALLIDIIDKPEQLQTFASSLEKMRKLLQLVIYA